VSRGTRARHAAAANDPDRLLASTAELTERARALIRPDRRVLLGITGAPGAGKSTLAAALERELGGLAAVVGMDGFHLAQEELIRLERQDRKGAADTFDAYGYAALLRRLRDNRDPVVYVPEFRRDLEEPVGSCRAIPNTVPLVITEGNYLLVDDPGWHRARAELDTVWFLDLPDEVRQVRLMLRHLQFGKDPVSAHRWATGSDQANTATVLASRPSADLAVRVLD
jgi:pantothenate kinase